MAYGRCNIAASGLKIKSLQRGTITADSTSGNYVNINAVDPTRSIILYDLMGYGGYPSKRFFLGTFTSPTRVEFTHDSYGAEDILNWTVIEFEGFKSIQIVEGEIITYSSDNHVQKDFLIQRVDTNKTMLFYTFYIVDGNSTFHNFAVEFANSGTLRAHLYDTRATGHFRAAVVEFA